MWTNAHLLLFNISSNYVQASLFVFQENVFWSVFYKIFIISYGTNVLASQTNMEQSYDFVPMLVRQPWRKWVNISLGAETHLLKQL